MIVLIAYYGQPGNTEKIAEDIGDAAANCKEVKLKKPADAGAGRIPDDRDYGQPRRTYRRSGLLGMLKRGGVSFSH